MKEEEYKDLPVFKVIDVKDINISLDDEWHITTIWSQHSTESVLTSHYNHSIGTQYYKLSSDLLDDTIEFQKPEDEVVRYTISLLRTLKLEKLLDIKK